MANVLESETVVPVTSAKPITIEFAPDTVVFWPTATA